MNSTNTTQFPTTGESYGANRGVGSSNEMPKYLNDFSRVLAREVRLLLTEVEKLREEKESLQQEVLFMKGLLNQQSANTCPPIPEWPDEARAPASSPTEASSWDKSPQPSPTSTSRFRWRKLTLKSSKKALAPVPKLPEVVPPVPQSFAIPRARPETNEHRYHYYRRSMSPVNPLSRPSSPIPTGSIYDGFPGFQFTT
ncbi:hypothetical protein FRC03_007171 [Tulasnella sp. 419]|nr:hypothetical protein FRC03_007171 [Tulasnella sp. 419]